MRKTTFTRRVTGYVLVDARIQHWGTNTEAKHCGSPLLKEENHYTFRSIPREHWWIGMSMARPS